MEDNDTLALSEISNNENVYKYISPFLYKKNMKFLSTAIKNLGGRDFEKKKLIIAGVYLHDNPDKLVGLAEMFDYNKRENKIKIGYRINETYWNKGIATSIIELLLEYLTQEIKIDCIEAFVMPENIYSSKALLKNGFRKEDYLLQEKNWGGKEVADVEVYTYMRENKVVFNSIDEYIMQFPEAVQRILHELRQVIKEAAPEASEK